MIFNISAFTNIGTVRKINQDRILVDDKILNEGFYHLENMQECFCFVADGIGGEVHGEIASQFILDKILEQKNSMFLMTEDEIEATMNTINKELIEYSNSKPEYSGTGSTLTGLLIKQNDEYRTFNAGDSEMWVLRNNMFFRITESQVFDDTVSGSPLISYFGGKDPVLDIDLNSTLREIHAGDVFVIGSDGLFNSLSSKQIKAILLNNTSLKKKSEFLLKSSLSAGASDNVSCILLELIG